MLSRILGWFGKTPENSKATNKKRSVRPASATAHLFEKHQGESSGHKPRAKANAGGGFDPYDTGKFDRSASWERISKTQR